MAVRSSSYLGENHYTTTAQIPVPSGATTNDIAVCVLYAETDNAITPPAGFTTKLDLNTGASNAYGRVLIAWKRLSANDTGTYDFSWSDNVYRDGGCILFSGRVTSGDPFEATSFTEPSSTTTATCAALSPAAAGDDLVGAASSFGGGGWTQPSGMTLQQGSQWWTCAAAENISAGSTGTKTFTAAASGHMKALIGALLPAAAATALPELVMAPRPY